MGDMYNEWREEKKRQKLEYQKNRQQKDVNFLHELSEQNKLAYTVSNDGAGGDKYTIAVMGNRGMREANFWSSTGKWKVKGGRAEGYGIYHLARYFNLIPKRNDK